MTQRLGKIHAADLRKSKRLQRVYWFLRDGKWHTTREVQQGANCCNPNTARSELEQNGCNAVCEQRGKYWYYRMISGVSWEQDIAPEPRRPIGMTAARREHQADMFGGVV